MAGLTMGYSTDAVNRTKSSPNGDLLSSQFSKRTVHPSCARLMSTSNASPSPYRTQLQSKSAETVCRGLTLCAKAPTITPNENTATQMQNTASFFMGGV